MITIDFAVLDSEPSGDFGLDGGPGCYFDDGDTVLSLAGVELRMTWPQLLAVGEEIERIKRSVERETARGGA